jgi:hypothetical protein
MQRSDISATRALSTANFSHGHGQARSSDTRLAAILQVQGLRQAGRKVFTSSSQM